MRPHSTGWRAACLAVLAGAACAQAIPDLGYTTRAGAALAASYARNFGPNVPERFARWAKFAAEQKKAGFAGRLAAAPGREARVLGDVNDVINRQVTGMTDMDHWRVVDYWATPAETIGSAAGDCEDYSIAKYYLLKELGVPISRLRITYVRVMPKGIAHMVLAYYATPEAEPLILDNLYGSISKASDRFDLDPVFHFNDDELQMVKSGQRSVPQLRAWLALQERLVMESALQPAPGS